MVERVENLPIFSVEVSERIRSVDEVNATAIANSISQSGQLVPIVVRELSDRFLLIDGAHRLFALNLLGETEVMAQVLDCDEDTARLHEIDANLMRVELTKLDRGISLKIRKDVYERKHPESGHGKASKNKDANIASFTEDVAEKVGLSQRAIQDAIAMVENFTPEVIAVLRSGPIADNAAQLKALAKLPPEDHMACAKALCDGTAENVKSWWMTKDSGSVLKPAPRNEWFGKTVKTWARAKKTWKKDFVREFESEIRKLLEEL